MTEDAHSKLCYGYITDPGRPLDRSTNRPDTFERLVFLRLIQQSNEQNRAVIFNESSFHIDSMGRTGLESVADRAGAFHS